MPTIPNSIQSIIEIAIHCSRFHCSEFVNVSENFELIPANRVMKITKEGKVLYSKKNPQI